MIKIISTLLEMEDALNEKDENLIYTKISNGSFDNIIPGLSLTDKCDQGSKKHLEGNVAKHTAKVIFNLIKFSSQDTKIQFDAIDLLAGLMHDLEKVNTRKVDKNGNVSFPEHEQKAASQIPEISKKLQLTSNQELKLHYLVLEHGNAHSLSIVNNEVQKRLVSSVYWRNLRLLQKADALSCYLNVDGTECLAGQWDLFERVRDKFC